MAIPTVKPLHPRICTLLCFLVGVVCAGHVGSRSAHAQSNWEINPYRAQVWWSTGGEPSLPAGWSERFGPELTTRLRTTFGAIWSGNVARLPSRLEGSLQRFDAEALLTSEPALMELDKLFLCSVRGHHSSYQVQVRELDCRLAHLGPLVEARVSRLDQLAHRVAQLIADAFSPVVELQRTNENRAFVRLRAAALLRDAKGPGSLAPGTLMLPFDRKSDGQGRVDLKDIRPVDWTYLLVDDDGQGLQREAEIISGFRQPFRAKRNRRLSQLAIQARPVSDRSVIRLVSRGPTPTPLVGYEIHEKGVHATEFLGYTDYRGELTVTATHRPVRVLLVRSGTRVTAKLPVVPGLRGSITAAMLDDRRRVETDGFLAGIQIALVDLVAQRESLTSRFRRRVADQEWDEAEQLLLQFKELPSQADFRRQIQLQQQALNVTEPQLRKRIDTMFVDAYRTLGEYLDRDRLRILEAELQAARRLANP